MARNPCVVELAELSNAVYADNGDPTFDVRKPTGVPGAAGNGERVTWKRTSSWRNLIGFYAAMFERDGSPRVLVFRGTDDGWDAVLDDAAIGLAGKVSLPLIPPQIAPALLVAGSAGLTAKEFVAGHSLGGALALLVATQLGTPAVTFNAPGVQQACMLTSPLAGFSFFRAVARCAWNPRVLNIRTDFDPVSSVLSTGLPVGGSHRTLGAKACGLDALCRHSIRTCIESVRKRAGYYDPATL